MTQLEVIDAKDRFAELLARARAGEEIVLAEGGKPVARLGPAPESPRRKGFGMFKGQIWISEDFNAPLTEEELKEWGL